MLRSSLGFCSFRSMGGIPELQLTNPNLTEDMAEIIDNSELDEDQQQKLERAFAKEYQLITRDERLERIAEDIVAHFIGRGVLAIRI